jgi:signal transduction histidine kinase
VTYTNSFTNVKIIVPQNINPDTTSVYIGLFAGYDGGYNVDTSTSYYDANPGGTPDLPCAGYLDGNTPMSCNAVNVNNSAPNYFFNNTINPPLNHWDFNQIWGVTSGLPILNPNRIVTPVTPPTSHNSAGQTHKNPIPYKPNSPPVKTPPTTKSTQKKSFITSATKNNVVAGFFKAIGNDLGSIVKKIPASVVVNFPYVLFAILLIGVFLAFSEWLRQSARLKRALRVVKKQQKLAEERDTFWHLAANYLRAPVTLLVGGAELLQDESFDPKITHRITTIASNLQLKVRSIMAKIERSTTLQAIEHPKETKTPSVFTDVRFWLPVLLVLGFGLLSNYIARDYRKINISTIHLWTELLLFVVIVVALYIVLDALGITSRRIDQTEQLIKEQEEELDTAREDLIGSTARELSGDVHRIETLVEEVPDKNKAHTILHEGSRRLRRIIETFTLLVKVQNEESAVDLTKNVSLSNVVDEATKDLNELIVSKNITLELTPPHSVMMVPGTSQFANQVVASILANAVDFSPLNGVIKVKLRQNGTMTSLTVSDQGQGMSDSQMSHLFSAFSRSDNSRALQIDHDGLGVSLYLDKLIMDQIGGTIEVESVVDKGTKFIITWPTPKETTFGSQILANN